MPFGTHDASAHEYLFYNPHRYKAKDILPFMLTYPFVADLAYPDATVISLAQYEISIYHSFSRTLSSIRFGWPFQEE